MQIKLTTALLLACLALPACEEPKKEKANEPTNATPKFSYSKADYEVQMSMLLGAYEYNSDKIVLQTREGGSKLHVIPVVEGKVKTSMRSVMSITEKVVTDNGFTITSMSESKNEPLILYFSFKEKGILYLHRVDNGNDTIPIAKGAMKSGI